MRENLNMVIDFNNIAMRAMFTCVYNEVGVGNFDTDRECGILARKISTDMAFILKAFNPDNVFVVVDSRKPWRGEIYDEIEDLEYKGTRVKDESKNWTKIYETFDTLTTAFKDNGINVLKIEHAEADDLAAMCVDNFRKNCIANTLLVSSDRDWHQLVYFSENEGTFCCAYNPIVNNKGKHVFVGTDEFYSWLEKDDTVDIFFNGFNRLKNKLNDIKVANSKISFEVITPYDVLLEKIICGDAGDNVPSFYEYYKNGKKYRITPLKLEHIKNNLYIGDMKALVESCNCGTLKTAISEELKREVDDVNMSERLWRQRKLVELNAELFPESITNAFKSDITKLSEKISVDCNSVKGSDFLKGTKYYKEELQPHVRENDVFDCLNGLEKYIKPIF